MRAITAEHLVAHLAFWILDQDAALRTLNKDDETDDDNRHNQQEDDQNR